jgi:type II secretory pathway pseudopilin PulG
MNRKMAGVTLIEVIVVIIIASGIFLLGMKFYNAIRRDGDVAQVKYNVDRIFAAATEYYQANCRWQRNPLTGVHVGVLTLGKLDPAANPGTPFPVTVTSLSTGGYLDPNSPIPLSPLINNATLNGGYIVQFNKAAPTDQLVSGNKMGKVIIWTVQVAVAIRNAAPLQMVKMLGADCAANASGNVITPCSVGLPASASQTVYAVWERLPSNAAPNAEADTWMGNAEVKAFTQLYTNNNIQNGQPGPSNTITNYQNYLCGS